MITKSIIRLRAVPIGGKLLGVRLRALQNFNFHATLPNIYRYMVNIHKACGLWAVPIPKKLPITVIDYILNQSFILDQNIILIMNSPI